MHARTRSMCLLAAYQGLRVSEIAKFRGSDIDPVARELRVIGKGGVDAVLPLHPIIEAEAEKYGPGWWFPQWKPNALGETGGHVLGRSVSTIIATEAAGRPASTSDITDWDRVVRESSPSQRSASAATTSSSRAS